MNIYEIRLGLVINSVEQPLYTHFADDADHLAVQSGLSFARNRLKCFNGAASGDDGIKLGWIEIIRVGHPRIDGEGNLINDSKRPLLFWKDGHTRSYAYHLKDFNIRVSAYINKDDMVVCPVVGSVSDD